MAYNMQKRMAEEGKKNWASAVRDLLCTNGFAFAWWNGSVGDETRFLKRLRDWLTSNWHFKQETKERYIVYSNIKRAQEKIYNGRDTKPAKQKKKQQKFTRFRLGILQILTHKRRHMGENSAMSRCRLYNGETENEVHLLATCGWYGRIRQGHLSQRFDYDVFQYNIVPVYLSYTFTFSAPYVKETSK